MKMRNDYEATSMDKETARSIIALATSMDSSFHEMFTLIEKISDDKIKASLKKSLGIALQNVTVGVIFSLENFFPDLKAD
jgi:hypothetical protein